MSPLEERVREQLVERRDRLADLARNRREEQLVELVRQVDDTLASLDLGTWGVCAVCHERMSEERLEADPLVRVCLDCLSGEERRELERDLEAAAKVQRALLPPARLDRDGWEIAYQWEPRGAVSGDHVDVVVPRQPGESLLVLLGDVAGKGVAASFLQAHLHALFRALTPVEVSLCELVGRANRLFAEATSTANYATLAALRLHPDGRAELANAGHPRPLLADVRGVRPIEGASLPLGLFCETTFVTRELRVAPGETLLLYSDGWTEAAAGDEEYGIGRAAAVLRRAARQPLERLLADCRADLERFLAGASRGDDLTLVAVRRAETAGVH